MVVGSHWQMLNLNKSSVVNIYGQSIKRFNSVESLGIIIRESKVGTCIRGIKAPHIPRDKLDDIDKVLVKAYFDYCFEV